MNYPRYILMLVVSILMQTGLALSAPMPLLMIVNNDSMECARFLPGDECMDCTPPAGWDILGPYDSCPENYKIVNVNGTCKGFENERCCTEKHTGASGDCRNLVINDETKRCAFVKNASNCSLPSGWLAMPKNASQSMWVCPIDYGWTALNCT
ncbi:MAG: hypothetical protein GYA39_00515 [Methanothrix sp.]|nr:hypothetical protein [Methanothrix sp.]